MLNRKQNGFTVVELLIVVVVVTILVIVAATMFRGHQIRAENTKTVHAVGQYAKALHEYATYNSGFPAEASFPCLGPSGTVCGRVSGVNCLGLGPAASTASFVTAMQSVITGSLPRVSSQSVTCGTSQLSGAFYTSGASGDSPQIYYILRGNQQCPAIGGTTLTSRTQQDDATLCRVALPA